MCCTVLHPVRYNVIQEVLFATEAATADTAGGAGGGVEDWRLVEPLQMAFYAPLTDGLQRQWSAWLRRWLTAVDQEGSGYGSAESTTAAADTTASNTEAQQEQQQQHRQHVAARMRRASPKYVPREWMLVEAYTAAAKGDYSVVHRLQELFRKPYDEQPGMMH